LNLNKKSKGKMKNAKRERNLKQTFTYTEEPLAKLFVIPECLYRGYGFSNS